MTAVQRPGRHVAAGHPRPAQARPGVDVDWERAGRWAGRLAPPGPTPGRYELERAVADLRVAADRARPLAVRASRLGRALDASGGAGRLPQVLVVDRPGWARAAGQSFATLAGPSAALGAASADPQGSAAPGATVSATVQAAGLLGLLAGRVLGQFDPFGGGPEGRLLLVAPNVLRTEHALSAVTEDFRLWVCVHEQTHALQFAAAPWLATHLQAEVRTLVDALAGASGGDELVAVLGAAVRALRSGRVGEEDWSLMDLLLDDEQRDRVERVTAVMSLLEGHADVSMDAVGSRAIPSARRLRARLEARRRRVRGPARVLQRLMGMDAKLAQYRRGAQFVRGVRRAGGRDALDAVWTGPAALPTPTELADPRSWVHRVHG